jgi:hypothetical protein
MPAAALERFKKSCLPVTFRLRKMEAEEITQQEDVKRPQARGGDAALLKTKNRY